MPTTPRLLASLLAALPLATTAACQWNEVETGKNGLVQLTPDDCGQLGCDLDDGVAVGGALTIRLSGTDGRSAADLELVSSAPWVIDVIDADTFGSEPEFRMLGTGAGRADLIVIDRAGYEIDYLPIEVATISAFALDARAAGLTELTVVGADRAFQAPVGADLELDVSGEAFGRQLTGDVQFLVELDQAIATAMKADADVARGHLHLTMPAGDHALRVTAPGGASQRILLLGR
ncbi:MAG: hypothetical protein IPH44_33005 [Myxococcales bacterium]|jgi:hypothetical protein|nr:hypothetical protein [Myxococcales bacterium]MBP6845981.1 hypothetical protein [Kofleriaceae bacterium]